MKVVFPIYVFILLMVSVSTAWSSFLIRDPLENYMDNPDYNILSCEADYPSHHITNYIYVIAKNRGDFVRNAGGTVGLFYEHQHKGWREGNILLDQSGLPSPYSHEWRSFKSYLVNPDSQYSDSADRYWFIIKWSGDSGEELLPDFEIRVFRQRPIPYLYPSIDNLDAILKCKLKS